MTGQINIRAIWLSPADKAVRHETYKTLAKSRHRAPHGSFMLRACFFEQSAVNSSSQSMSFIMSGHASRRRAIIFSDLIGKLDLLRVRCDKCDGLSRLIDKRG
jgi:hypothetical protein